MPIEFTQTQQPTEISGDTLYEMAMAYDGSGRRISKTRWVKARGDAGWQRRHVTHYTGIGTEVRENFTGKSMQGECSENALVYFHCRAAGDCALRNELDDETQLNYFGARYFDPFFGLWMSPNPAGQFANPYGYGGDPVNFVDPNGEYRTINRKG